MAIFQICLFDSLRFFFCIEQETARIFERLFLHLCISSSALVSSVISVFQMFSGKLQTGFDDLLREQQSFSLGDHLESPRSDNLCTCLAQSVKTSPRLPTLGKWFVLNYTVVLEVIHNMSNVVCLSHLIKNTNKNVFPSPPIKIMSINTKGTSFLHLSLQFLVFCFIYVFKSRYLHKNDDIFLRFTTLLYFLISLFYLIN